MPQFKPSSLAFAPIRHSKLRSTFFFFALAGVWLTLASTADAAAINWGTGAKNITGDSDVSTAGALFGALNVGTAQVGDNTVNGVAFTAIAVPNGGFNATSGYFTFNAVTSLEGGYATPSNSLSSSYGDLLGWYGSCLSSTMTIEISNLTIGRDYEFQWWCNYSNSTLSRLTTATADGGGAVTLNYNTTSSVNGLDQFAIGTFTADATATTITFSSSNKVIVNAVQLRDVTVPEPSMLAPLAAFVVLLQRRCRCGT